MAATCSGLSRGIAVRMVPDHPKSIDSFSASSCAVGTGLLTRRSAGLLDPLRTVEPVVITRGYELVVTQAQHPVADLVRRLRERGVTVRFGIHPVAGRQ